ncbi:hypothetical protein KM92DES2_10656 [uncultured Desulfovibrio sp.]|uniref:Uncharacterized protein n=1 Tax=uncultured Desulfovibrio sp. TaxID=167968 RepID=A0A212J7I3_9BACT|nr:hypothetical protein KM92DES2_10656 [uncultured Desulfovibrio sp.]
MRKNVNAYFFIMIEVSCVLDAIDDASLFCIFKKRMLVCKSLHPHQAGYFAYSHRLSADNYFCACS